MQKFCKKIVILIIFILLGFTSIAKAEVDVAIIGAMDCEIDYIKMQLNHPKITTKRNLVIYKGNIGKNKVVLTKSGIGKVNSATTTQFLIDTYKPKMIINIGVAGGLNKDLKVGDVVVASDLVQFDFDLTHFGYPKGTIYHHEGEPTVTTFKPHETYVNKISNNFENMYIGRIASGDEFVANSDRKEEIYNNFSAMAVEMEGAAIAHCAELNNIPVVVLRVISDVSNNESNEYKQYKQSMGLYCSKIIIEFLQHEKI